MAASNEVKQLTEHEKAQRFDAIKELLDNRSWCGCHPDDMFMYFDIMKICNIVNKGVESND